MSLTSDTPCRSNHASMPYHLDRYGGIDEVGGADLDSRGAGHQELQRIRCVHDAAQTNNGNIDGIRYLPHHAQGYGFYGRAR